MKETIVPSAWLEESGHRLDSGPYLSGAMEAKVLLAKLETKKLHQVTRGGLTGIFNGPRFSRSYVVDHNHGVPFLGSTDILHADLSYLPMLAKRQVEARPELLIDEHWTLISCSGTVGRMAFSRPDMKGMAGSQHFMRVVPDPAEIYPGYLHAFLSSRFGVPIVISGKHGSIVQHIEPVDIADLPVPLLGSRIERKVHKLISEAAALCSEFQKQARDATEKLFNTVGLSDITPGAWHNGNFDLGFVRELRSPASLRARNFNPRFQQLCILIKSRSWRSLGDLCEQGSLRRGGRYKRVDADPEFAYRLIGQKEMFWLRPEGRWIARKSVGNDVIVEPGTTLVAAQGTLGESELYCRAEFIWGPALEAAYSEHLLRVISNEQLMPRGCLFAFMRSETAFRMLRSISFGTKLQDHHPGFLRELPVPYPDKRAQQEIHELVVDAYEKRHRSVKLEDEAVALVERAIEEGT